MIWPREREDGGDDEDDFVTNSTDGADFDGGGGDDGNDNADINTVGADFNDDDEREADVVLDEVDCCAGKAIFASLLSSVDFVLEIIITLPSLVDGDRCSLP